MSRGFFSVAGESAQVALDPFYTAVITYIILGMPFVVALQRIKGIFGIRTFGERREVLQPVAECPTNRICPIR